MEDWFTCLNETLCNTEMVLLILDLSSYYFYELLHHERVKGQILCGLEVTFFVAKDSNWNF